MVDPPQIVRLTIESTSKQRTSSASKSEVSVPFPRVEAGGRVVILLSGIDRASKGYVATYPLKVHALESLNKSAEKHADAVAFGYVAGRWLPAA